MNFLPKLFIIYPKSIPNFVDNFYKKLSKFKIFWFFSKFPTILSKLTVYVSYKFSSQFHIIFKIYPLFPRNLTHYFSFFTIFVKIYLNIFRIISGFSKFYKSYCKTGHKFFANLHIFSKFSWWFLQLFQNFLEIRKIFVKMKFTKISLYFIKIDLKFGSNTSNNLEKILTVF